MFSINHLLINLESTSCVFEAPNKTQIFMRSRQLLLVFGAAVNYVTLSFDYPIANR